MEAVDVTKLSSKGQVVIPMDVRMTLGLETGARFVVYGQRDTVILKRIGKPSREEGRRLLADSRALARKSGLKKAALATAISRVQGSR